VLNQAHLRMTRQRTVILEKLRKVATHPSADEIYEMVRKRLPRISLGTVYRNLEILIATRLG
jgi:Fur family transcriptional regulator, ferric uptake regulator